jgi:hypothetical protein
MGKHSMFTPVVAGILSVGLALPPNMLGQAAASPQRAGQVAQVIPTVNIQRGPQQVEAVAQAAVFWQDVVSTQRRARARLTLDDGSVLNVGSESSLTLTRHDPATSQTELELSFGRLRSQVTKSARPGASYRVRTPTAVAGVVGTDFILIFENNISTLIVYEGIVEFCNLAGACVMVGQGMTSSQRSNEAPTPPIPVTQSQAMQAAQSTQVVTPVAAAAAGHSLLATIFAIATVIVPAVIAVNVSPNADKVVVRCQSSSQPQQACGTQP